MTPNQLNMNGKVCLVTGATSGLGWVTAREFAKSGAELVLTGRNIKRGMKSVELVREQQSDAKVEFTPMDLSSQEQIRKFSSAFKSRYPRLDVLVNNAGTVLLQRKVNADGIEMTFAVNHLGHFLLTNLLLESLRASESARVIMVSSGSHRRAQLNFGDLQNEIGYSGLKVYGQSKLANVLFAYELARRLERDGIAINAMAPGFVSTNLGRDNGWILHKLIRLAMLTGGSVEQGAETIVYLASSAEIEDVTGKYFRHNQAIPSSKLSYDRDVAKRLWKISEELTGWNGV